jgi:hypothetical protein
MRGVQLRRRKMFTEWQKLIRPLLTTDGKR